DEFAHRSPLKLSCIKPKFSVITRPSLALFSLTWERNRHLGWVLTNPTTVLAVGIAAFTAGSAFAVTEHKPAAKPFLHDITTFTTTIALPLKEEVEKVTIPRRKLEERLRKSEKDKTVEPLNVMIGPEDAQLLALAE